ncbi:MAG: metallophosphoesterase [Patescibacteria group bacterium]
MNLKPPPLTAHKTIAHLSDLHLGRSTNEFAAALALRETLEAEKVDHVIVTGDVTDHGRGAELRQFDAIFGPWREAGRLTVVPGNHDRLGDEVSEKMMTGPRVDFTRRDGLFIVRVNSTGPHNRFLLTGHGKIDEQILDETDRLVRQASDDDLVVVALHHHLLPLPEDLFIEKVSNWLGLPFASELLLGRILAERLRGRCDLVLHGHRHMPKETLLSHQGRNLGIYNAGSSTKLGSFRLFTHHQGSIVGAPAWVPATGRIVEPK